jgi:8-amino-7-oxononanoate synthase
MGLFDRHAGLLEAYRDVRTTGYDPFQIRMERVLSPTEAIINGRKTLLVGTNNYFGLTFDPSCMEAAIEAIRAEGTGTTGSRIANGSYSEHVALEKEIAEFYGKKHCMVFTTGYQANSRRDLHLAGQGDFLLIDADSHASIYDCLQDDPGRGRALQAQRPVEPGGPPAPARATSPATAWSCWKASIPCWATARRSRSSSTSARNTAPTCWSTRPIRWARWASTAAGSARRRRARRLPLHRRHLLQDPGAIGGYCVSDDPDFDILRVTVRAYMFTASLPPSIVASVRQALRVVKAGPSCASSSGTTSPRSMTA